MCAWLEGLEFTLNIIDKSKEKFIIPPPEKKFHNFYLDLYPILLLIKLNPEKVDLGGFRRQKFNLMGVNLEMSLRRKQFARE